ncbi:hypothetical protein [Streptomyces sp. N502]|uniref:hypothetical protein n=1 Tax=Streptomyces sp. N502 TaxID=2730916 RepID=UPI001487EC5C|nr:hypothetical protein [Streptomyces sp. N502]
MTTPARTRMSQLDSLRRWLRHHKGRQTYDELAACPAHHKDLAVSACTLRRALDGRMPTWRTVHAFAHATGADLDEARRLWEAAHTERQNRTGPASPRPYTPRRIRTRKGLAAALRRVRTDAGSPSLRALQDSPQANGQLPKSTLCEVLRGRLLPSTTLLQAFLRACHAPDHVVSALLAARARIATGHPRQARTYSYICEAAEEADYRNSRHQPHPVRATSHPHP